jgi:hypothetical protein
VVAVLFSTGDQLPVIPFKEVVGKALKVCPLQIGATALKVGNTFGFTVIVNVAVKAHRPLVGVKVYEVVAKLFNTGDHVPVIPFKEVIGKALKVCPLQIGATPLNVGNTFGFTVIVNVVIKAHCPTEGVNVYVVVAVLFKAGDQVPVILFKEVVGNATIV